MTPMFIQEPFWNLTYSLPKAFYITINPKDAILPREIEQKGLAIKEDIALVLQEAVRVKERGKQGAWRSIVTKTSHGTAMGLLYKIYLQYVASAYRSAISGS